LFNNSSLQLNDELNYESPEKRFNVI